MTWPAAIVAIVALLLAAAVCGLAYAIVRDRRRLRRWRAERRRIAEYHERVAAENSRPHTDAVIQRATRRS